MLQAMASPGSRSTRASITCCASTFQRAGERESELVSQFHCVGPSMVADSARDSGQGGFLPSPHGWSVRYCRVSSTQNRVS